MKIERKATAVWTGGLKDGRGALTTESGVLSEQRYGFASRFEGERGTNPEELIGAAHAGCFVMALSNVLGEAGLKPERLEAQAAVALERAAEGFAIPAIRLTLRGKVPGADEARFRELAEKAKATCPVSRLLKAEITLDARLDSGG